MRSPSLPIPPRATRGPVRPAAGRRRRVALLLVLIILLLVATLATEIAITARTHAKLADHAMSGFLLRSVVDGRREICIAALKHETSLESSMVMEDALWSWNGGKRDVQWRDTWGKAGGEGDAGGSGSSSSSNPNAAKVYRNKDVKFRS